MPAYDPRRRGTWYGGRPITTPPELVGQPPRGRGRAWRVDWSLAHATQQMKDAIVGSWVVHAPGSNQFWDHYLFSVAHLRPVEGVEPIRSLYEGATHMVSIVVLDPGYPLPDPAALTSLHYLDPAEFSEQFKVPDDLAADQVLETLVTLAVDNILPPNREYSDAWTAALWKTANRLCQDGNRETKH